MEKLAYMNLSEYILTSKLII